MTIPQTLLQMADANLEPADLQISCLVLIDFQQEYLTGPLAVSGGMQAVANARRLGSAARMAGAPIIHIAHKGRAGGLFDRDADRGKIIKDLSPVAGEQMIEKGLPNAFAGTSLQSVLSHTKRNDIIICGFMTHMCVSSTARAALDLGYRVTIDAASCATRELPNGDGGVIAASVVHETSLAALADRFAVIARDHYYTRS